jgi:hypothetical protein
MRAAQLRLLRSALAERYPDVVLVGDINFLAKEIGQKALDPCGLTVVHDGISPETQFADLRHEPDPARKAERARLGLLGRISAVLCLIEVYGHAPSAEEFRACLAKHLAFWQQRARNKKRRQKRQARKKFIEPSLWIIAAGAPTTLLTKLMLAPARGCVAGVYHFGTSAMTSSGSGSWWQASCPGTARPSSSACHGSTGSVRGSPTSRWCKVSGSPASFWLSPR